MSERKKILLIDDEKGFSVMLKLNLESSEQYEVLIENDSRNGLETALNFKPDLILLDVIMPHLEGPDVARKIEDNPQLHKVPIIFLTAMLTFREMVENNGSIGGRPFIAKPSDIEIIVNTIEQHLNG